MRRPDERLYDVQLTWDEIDDAMMALRALIADGERHASAASDRGAVYAVAEEDQSIAALTELLHRLGDARRVAHGEAPVVAS